MNESGSNQKASSLSNPFINDNSETTISTDLIQPRRPMVQNYSLIWLNEYMDETSKDYENSLIQIQTIADNVNVFKQRDECIDFLTDTQDIESFLIVENAPAQQIMPLINDIAQLNSVYIFSNIKPVHEETTKQWRKIKSVHTNIDDLCKALQVGIKQYNQDSIAVSFVPVNEIASTTNLNQLEPTFMYTQIFKDILLDMEHNKQAIDYFITYSRQNNCSSTVIIDRFEKEYRAQSAIWWYTFTPFIYCMLNAGLRSMEGNIIINMGFLIHDLHLQIQQLHQQQVNSYHDISFVVYRGQGLSKANFEKLQKTKGGLMSFNNFLSTSTDKEVSRGFAERASTEPDTVGILFIMSIDPCIKSPPFAFIKEMSCFQEEDEILFSMHTVFRVTEIKQIDNNNLFFQVELQLTSDDDQQLRVLTDRIRREADGDTGWERLGKLLLKIGQFNKAEELYNVLLEQTSNNNEKALYYGCLGYIKDDQGDYEKAIWYYEKSLEIYQKIFPSNHPSLAISYNNIGLVCAKIKEYSKAISLYEKALEIFEKTLPSDHPHLASSYNNIGSVYYNMKEYSKALTFFEKALEIQQKTLPSNHPLLATSYNNIGALFDNMKEYSKALSSHEKALEIRQKTFPSNHPELASSYHNISLVYYNMKYYSKALSNLERALDILQRALPPTHPNINKVKEGIEIVKEEMRRIVDK
ncbi:unnamed protein product [Adineta steineri]|uniref:Multifunctional fusion protein n=1 Tax=Adineta steineri TaxID=433720 RepID=A0A813ZCE0_9BILA|nr:unnamed protein product [Adineta steineri]CAF1428384.1 unnamed protein product [Adineta steineri]